MSTLPSVASKGEKGKSKYQSLDINNLYKVYTSEPSETQQPKNTLPRKHGMQSLGKVPTARRPPANLPSLKSEHTGSDAAVSLVPSGGAGWGKQEPHSPSSTTPPSITSVPNSNTTSPSSANVQQNTQPAVPIPVPPAPPVVKHHLAPTATPVTADKSWSSIMSGADIFHPPPYQSPQFQHEFPSLSAGDGAPPRIGADTQYGPGPSLRPQTEGSWIQGGVRPGTETIPKGNSGQLAPQPQLSAQGGPVNQQQQQPLPPQFRGVIPPFMYRGNFTPNGPVGPNFTGIPGSVNNGRTPAMENRVPKRSENDEVCHRPIIKEEELNRMDDMTRDVGWASHDDIDYNQKLAFSDDEGEVSKNKHTHQREHDKTEHNSHEVNNKNNWSTSKTGSNNAQSTSSQANKNRSNEEDEVWIQRRRQQSEEVAIAVERAKQRKEEEEKRFLETKQAAAKKLQQLEEKISKCKLDKETEDSQGTINPSVVPPQPITPVPIPVPDWEKEKDIRSRPSTAETSNNKTQYRESSDFRKLTQIEARSFVRKETRSSERDTRDRDQTAPNFSKQFQSNLPPRFLKQQQLRSNSTSTPQSPPISSSNTNIPFSEQHDNLWQQNQAINKATTKSYKPKPEMEDPETHQDTEIKDAKSDSDDNYRASHTTYSDTNKTETKYDEEREYKNEDFNSRRDTKKDERHEKEIKVETKTTQQGMFHDHRGMYHGNDRDKIEEKYHDKYERPQRPDSRDSRTSRESRHSRESEPRDYHGSWADLPYDDRRKEHYREDRRPVPGPITRDRIEADDLKSEKKNLTALKRGCIPEKRASDSKKDLESEKVSDDGWKIPKNRDNVKTEPKTSSETHLTKTDNTKFVNVIEKPKLIESVKEEKRDDIDNRTDDKDRRSANNRRHGDSRQPTWGPGYVYHRSWTKKSDSRRGGRNGGVRKSSNKSGESHGTDSDVSGEDVSASHFKKSEKDDKNKEIRQEKTSTNNDRKSDSNRKDYLPRGEPSRHGRGAGNFRNRGGLGKRIDGYGPPPSKSPFSQLEDKDKKILTDDVTPSDNTSSDEKTKQNQQALSAGIIGTNRIGTSKDSSFMQQMEEKFSKGTKGSTHNQHSKKETYWGENWDTSENSDESGIKEQKPGNKFGITKGSTDRSAGNSGVRRNNPAPRFANEKRNYNNCGLRQNSRGSLKSGGGSGKTMDDSKNKNKNGDETIAETDTSEKVCDSDGFQEVKSKKTGLRQKSCDDKPVTKPLVKPDKPPERKKSNGPMSQLTPEQIASLPSLMDTPINPPVLVPTISNKNQYDRTRQNKLPPRFVKQLENSRLQKAQMQQGMCDLNEMNKVNHNLSMYGVKDTHNNVSGRIGNAWEKPLSTHIRTEQEVMLSVGMEPNKPLEQPQAPTSPSVEKAIKSNHVPEKTVLDGATPPVNTIIFENTNFKTAPGSRPARSDKTATTESVIDQTVITSFNKPVMRDLINKNEKPTEQIDMNDMKLDFFETEISHLTDDKGSKNLSLPRSMHAITSVNNTLSASTADVLNFKIASVKKVWENAPTGIEHSVGQEDSNSSFSSSFGADPNTLDPSTAFGKTETPDDTHETYAASPNQNTSNNTTNVCKVKPTQQITTGGQAVHVPGTHPQHSAVVGPGIVGHPLSPPPIPPVLGGVSIGQPPQQYTSNQHISYQPNLGGSNQYGMSAIPSPPAVLFNSTPQIQAAQTGLYGPFQLDQAQVLSSQGRTQFSQYPYGLGQTASSPYSAQSMYLPGGQPHPPTGQPPPDLYQNLNSYRLSTTGPFGQGQQLTNPSTVLISSTSNSLMSATVKPTTQQISAIGTKANGAGQAYQQQSQQGQQLYMTYDPTLQANYLPSTGVMQRGTAPLQNNVVPTIQPSSSYYTGSTGGQTSFFQQPASSTLQSAQLPHTGYSLQGNMFGSHSQSHASAGLQNFGSHFLSSPMQLAAAALTAQQFRSNNLQNSPYVKGVTLGDQGSRPQQIKSPGSQQDVLSSVFNSGPQIPSPKSRQNMKQPPPQPSPTAQLKYNIYQTVGNQPQQAPRFPTPIQRPATFQQTIGAMQNTGLSNNPKHRSAGQSNKLSGRNYYGGQGSNLSTTQNDKNEDSKLGDTTTSITSNSAIVTNTTSIVTKAIITTNSTITVNQTTEIKETSTKDETSVIKD